MKYILIAISIIMLFVVQISFLPFFKVLGVIPAFLLPIFFVFYALELKKLALILGISLALLLDIYFSGSPGLSVFFILVCFLMLNFLENKYFEELDFSKLLFLFPVFVFIYEAINLFLFKLMFSTPFIQTILKIVLPQVLISLILFIFTYYLVRYIQNWLEKNNYLKGRSRHEISI